MNKPSTASKLSALVEEAKRARGDSGAYAFLPEIIDSLAAMQTSLDLDLDRRSRMAAALERLVTENHAFSESALGQALLEFSGDFASE